jgi:hypothetical protein
MKPKHFLPSVALQATSLPSYVLCLLICCPVFPYFLTFSHACRLLSLLLTSRWAGGTICRTCFRVILHGCRILPFLFPWSDSSLLHATFCVLVNIHRFRSFGRSGVGGWHVVYGCSVSCVSEDVQRYVNEVDICSP